MNNKDKIIGDFYGGSGSWSYNYKEAGYTVVVIDILKDPAFNVRLFTPKLLGISYFYGMLFAPPCTDLAGSGARWWRGKGQKALLEALAMVDVCFRLVWLYKPHFWALENPVGRLVHYLGEPKLIFNPCDYGDPYTKKTCLWGEFNIPEKNPVAPSGKNPIHYMSPGKARSGLRSITPQGFAKAFYEANK